MDANTQKQINDEYQRAGSPERITTSTEPLKPIPVLLALIAIIVRLTPWIVTVIIIFKLLAAVQP